MPRIASSLLLVALLLSSSGYAQRIRPRTIRGVVRYGAGPVRNARVTIVGHGVTLTTKADGSFAYCCLRDSVVTMEVIVNGQDRVMVCASGDAMKDLDVTLRGLDIVTNGDPECILYGDVRDREGKPIIGATIRLIGRESSVLSEAPNGNFIVRKVPIGSHTIEMSAAGHDTLRLEIGSDGWHPQQVLFIPNERREERREQ